MINTVNTKGIASGTLFKLLFLGYLFTIGPFVIVCGIFSLFGYGAISFSGETLVGWHGFLVSFIMAPIAAFLTAITNWIVVGIGLWIYTRFGRLKLRYKDYH